MTADLLRSTGHKHSLSIKCRKNPNNTILVIHYKNYIKNYQQIMGQIQTNLGTSKKTFYENELKSISDNLKLT